MSQECLMSGCQRKFSMENCKKESAHKVAKRNATKTPLKPRLRISIFQLSPGNRLLRIEQSGIASSAKVPPNLKHRESVKLKGNVKKGKQEPRYHHQTQHRPNCSICNRQFRAKVGLYSHQHHHHHHHIRFRARLSLSRVGLFDKSSSKTSSPLRAILRVSRDHI